MGKQFDALNDQHKAFIAEQKLFFVATAASQGRVNVSPKGMDSLRVIDSRKLVWLNVTGSGNETAAHVVSNPRMTIMFAAFEGKPLILRVYGEARAVHRQDEDWRALSALFPSTPGARQFFVLDIELVQNSCGMAVPLFDYVGERNLLSQWAEKKGESGIEAYWREKNQASIDGLPTHIVEKNLQPT